MRRETRIVASVLTFVSIAMLGASSICTWAIAHGASMRWRLLFRMLCHGIPQRCLYLGGVPMPICARCVAIYGGLAAGIILFTVVPLMTETMARRLLFLAAIPMLIDGLTQLAMLRESTNALRLVTGLLAGTAFSLWALTAMESRVLTSS